MFREYRLDLKVKMFRKLWGSPRTLQRVSPLVRGNFRPQPPLSCFLHSGTPVSASAQQDSLPPTFIEQYKLDDPTRWVPISVGSLIVASSVGLYHWDAESQMLGLFVLFVGTVYSQGGAAIAKYFDDEADAIQQEFTDAENERITVVKDRIKSLNRYKTVEEDMAEYVALMKSLRTGLIEAAPLSFEHRKRDFFANKLEKIIKVEAEVRENMNKALIEKAAQYARDTFASDQGLQRRSLVTAFKWLQAPEGQKEEMTEVGDIFKTFFQRVRDDPSATADIEANLKAELDKIVNDKFEVIDEFEALSNAK